MRLSDLDWDFRRFPDPGPYLRHFNRNIDEKYMYVDLIDSTPDTSTIILLLYSCSEPTLRSSKMLWHVRVHTTQARFANLGTPGNFLIYVLFSWLHGN